MKRTALYDTHIALGARMVEFGGWAMPVQYSGILDEHNAVRTAAGIFDIDHMGQVEVQGPDALAYLQHMATNDIAGIDTWQSAYGLLCYPNGGVVDDIFTYRLSGRFFLAINASNTEKDVAWLLEHTAGYNVQVKNVSAETCMLALQGPKAEAMLQKLTPAPLAQVPRFGCVIADVAHVSTLIGRTGYTGEDGFELFFPVAQTLHVWNAIMAAGAPLGLKPCGLGARDSLRFEAKMPLYGQEIGPDINPIEAGLGWAVAFDAPGKPDFIGRAALLQAKTHGTERKLVGFEMIDHGIARHEYQIADKGAVIGHVTTGMYSPTLKKNIGLGYVPARYAKKGSTFDVIIRGKPLKAVVIGTPFYKRSM